MSTSKTPVAAPIPLLSAEKGDLPDVSSTVVLAPKSPNHKLQDNTDKNDGQTVVSPIEKTEITNITSDSFTEIPNLVEIISKVLATTLHELKAVNVSPNTSVQDTSSHSPSVVDMPHETSSGMSNSASSEAQLQELFEAQDETTQPSSVPEVIASTIPSTSDSMTKRKHQFGSSKLRTKVATGPPSDPKIEASVNFASRKKFHGYDLPSTTSTSTSLSANASPFVSHLSHPVRVDGKQTLNSQKDSRVYSTHEDDTSQDDMRSVHQNPFLAPKRQNTPPDANRSVSQSSVPVKYSPKPMTTFKVSKWTKEIKDISIEDETFESVISWYDALQQTMVVSTERSDVMPDIEDLHTKFLFYEHILPSPGTSVYKTGMMEYVSMAKALRIYLLTKSSISSACTVLTAKRNLYRNQKDGFVLLLRLLGGIFPHLGGPQLDVINEISSIKVHKNETLNSLLDKFISLDRRLELSGRAVSPTVLFQRYLDIISQNDRIFSLISPICRSFHNHMKHNGPDVLFEEYGIHEIHEYIVESRIDPDIAFLQKKNHHQRVSVTPQACSADIYDLFDPESERQGPQMRHASSSHPQANAASMAMVPFNPQHNRSRFPKCPICFQRHIPIRCWARGTKFQPLWLQRNVAKYNALHPNEVPDEKYINQAPPLRSPQFNAQANKSVSFASSPPTYVPQIIAPPITPEDITSTASIPLSVTVTDDDTLLSTPEVNQSVTHPTCNMAKNDDTSSSSTESHSFTNPTCSMANDDDESVASKESQSFVEA